MLLRHAEERDLVGILDIYNRAVLTSTAIWNDTLVDLANRRAWLADRISKRYPVMVAVEEDEDGAVLGYASFGDFRPFDGYRISVEHSVYVAEDARGRGIGGQLVGTLFEPARALGKKVMIGGITAGNAASIALHRKLGFEESGHMRGIGIKFGQRLDLVLMQKEL
ncbi:N-acetyltransferase [Ancylobacter defluvii]|uniref:N-acetyltransferase n=2 Tax=Ancylobacter defluvii TaxID=1282440 RepID=A0A9W6K0J8_9HYPH|nr:GNAT family N-acetyltransferase [Ancylobacter defluvii]MBS7589700.1 N-acetyltransferase [Ancylobacter defluvii]GLK85324.1 N-acetyltransferase [Ancylobacter defluvii]